jgi:hypothetical protein
VLSNVFSSIYIQIRPTLPQSYALDALLPIPSHSSNIALLDGDVGLGAIVCGLESGTLHERILSSRELAPSALSTPSTHADFTFPFFPSTHTLLPPASIAPHFTALSPSAFAAPASQPAPRETALLDLHPHPRSLSSPGPDIVATTTTVPLSVTCRASRPSASISENIVFNFEHAPDSVSPPCLPR